MDSYGNCCYTAPAWKIFSFMDLYYFFYLQPNFTSSQDVATRSPKPYPPHFIPSYSYLPLVLVPPCTHLPKAAQILSTILVPLLLHIPFPIFPLPPPSVSLSFHILLLCTSPTQAPHSSSPILALQSSCFHHSRLVQFFQLCSLSSCKETIYWDMPRSRLTSRSCPPCSFSAFSSRPPPPLVIFLIMPGKSICL